MLELQIINVNAGALTQKPPLVFLHEGLGCVSLWHDFPTQLCRTVAAQGLVYSRLGYGQSAAIADVRGHGKLGADYLHRQAFEVLPALLAEHGIPKPILIGHSDGASIALLYASRFETAACVALAPHVVVEDICIEAIQKAKHEFEKGRLRTRLAKHHADVDSAFWQWCDIWLSADFARFDIRAYCARIRCPLLLIQGKQDPYGSAVQIDAISAAATQAQTVWLEDCGHAPQHEQREKTVAAIRKFLKTRG